MKVLDFRSKPDTIGVIQPEFKLQGYDVEVSVKRNDFRIEAGCQKVTVSAHNVNQMLSEIAGEEKEDQLIKVIVPKESTKEIKSIKSVPRFLEESANFFVSASRKLYDKTAFKVIEQSFKMPNEYFTVNRYGSIEHNGYSLTKAESEKLVFILTIIRDYFKSLESSVQEEEEVCESEEAILSEDKCQ